MELGGIQETLYPLIDEQRGLVKHLRGEVFGRGAAVPVGAQAEAEYGEQEKREQNAQQGQAKGQLHIRSFGWPPPWRVVPTTDPSPLTKLPGRRVQRIPT